MSEICPDCKNSHTPSHWHKEYLKGKKLPEDLCAGCLGKKMAEESIDRNFNTVYRFFESALDYCIKKGYAEEIEFVRNRYFNDSITSWDFYVSYVYVVLNTGMRNQVAEKLFDNLMKSGDVDKTIKHKGKNKAIKLAMANYETWFKELKVADDKIEYLKSLFFIGDITKYHLARNIGIDVAKPDRHLQRIADKYGFDNVHEMCELLSEETGERIGTVDVILWRYCNLTGGV